MAEQKVFRYDYFTHLFEILHWWPLVYRIKSKCLVPRTPQVPPAHLPSLVSCHSVPPKPLWSAAPACLPSQLVSHSMVTLGLLPLSSPPTPCEVRATIYLSSYIQFLVQYLARSIQ